MTKLSEKSTDLPPHMRPRVTKLSEEQVINLTIFLERAESRRFFPDDMHGYILDALNIIYGGT